MIRSFRDKRAETIWRGQSSRKLPVGIQSVVRRKLRMLNNAETLDDRVGDEERLAFKSTDAEEREAAGQTGHAAEERLEGLGHCGAQRKQINSSSRW